MKLNGTRAGILLALLCEASLAEALPFDFIELTPPRQFLMLKRDVTAVATAPLEWDASTWKKVAVGAGVIGALMLVDTKVREEALRHSDESVTNIADAVEPFGSDYSWAVLGAFYGAGKLLKNERAAAVAEDGLVSSVIAAGIITPALKTLAGRRRPSQDPRSYAFFETGASFPSGHTTQAFAIATVIAQHYDSRWIDALAYGTAGLVGYSRIQNGAHFLSDVVAGAVIGTVVGKTVVRLNHENRGVVAVEPMVSRTGAPGLSVRFSF